MRAIPARPTGARPPSLSEDFVVSLDLRLQSLPMAPRVSGTLYDRITEVVFNRYFKVTLLPRTFKYFDSLIRVNLRMNAFGHGAAEIADRLPQRELLLKLSDFATPHASADVAAITGKGFIACLVLHSPFLLVGDKASIESDSIDLSLGLSAWFRHRMLALNLLIWSASEKLQQIVILFC
jgi:hypothetical protein